MVAKFSPLLWAVLVFVAKPALADNFTYKQYSASSEDWKRGFVFAVAQHHHHQFRRRTSEFNNSRISAMPLRRKG